MVAALPSGTKLSGRYTLRETISRGGMGQVYRALDEESCRDIALKRLLDLRHETRFTIEARLLSQLRHRRVVRVLGHFHDKSGMYLVMELVSGKDLERLLRERGNPGLPVEDAV